ncbi:MAG: endonuclease Q family protein, partial [Patescibacteria group bacterium]
KNMDLESLDEGAKLKGIKVLGTGDFTHPEWFKELKSKFISSEPGLFKIKNTNSETRFILTVEISCIYSKKGRVRRIHLLIFAPSFEAVEKLNLQLGWIGNLKADGRPILGLDAKELVKIILNISDDFFILPAHAWTPWFSVFGSKSGFDSIEECFEDYSKYIFAIETGLSSDPAMNWRLSALDKISLISCSDAHSPAKLGREATVFNTELSYPAIIEAIKSRDPQSFLYTIEFFPQEGKYHFDGHRLCNISLSPQESKKHNNTCFKCHHPLTIGVLNRVGELADRPEGFQLSGAIPFKSLIPLGEIIADVLGVGVGTKQVDKEYKKLIESFGNELDILIETKREDLEKVSLSEIVEGIIRVRGGKVQIEPGFDGVYGKIKIFGKEEQKGISSQKSLI